MSLMNSYFKINMASKFLDMLGINTAEFVEPIKECLAKAKDEFLVSVASNMPADSINEFVTNKVEVDTNLSEAEIAERIEVVDKFKEVIETAGSTATEDGANKLSNITDAIDSAPDEWGQILSTANVTPEVLDNMATAIENGESISSDLVNIAYGAATGAVVDMAEKFSKEGKDSPEQTAEASVETEVKTNQSKQASENSLAVESTLPEPTLPESPESIKYSDAEITAKRTGLLALNGIDFDDVPSPEPSDICVEPY